MTMKLKVQHLMDATIVITSIIREDRPLPQKGKYRLARMHPKLDKEFQIVNERRNDMIKAYGHHPLVPNPAFNREAAEGVDPASIPEFIPHTEFSVPEDKLAEFQAAWEEIANEEIEVEIQPIPLEQLILSDNTDGCIGAHELIVLGDLVQE